MGQRLMAKQTKITIETDSLLILRGRSSVLARCPLCRADAEMIDLAKVGVISNLDLPALEEWLNSPDLHRSSVQESSTLVCLKALLSCLQNKVSLTRKVPNQEEEM